MIERERRSVIMNIAILKNLTKKTELTIQQLEEIQEQIIRIKKIIRRKEK